MTGIDRTGGVQFDAAPLDDSFDAEGTYSWENEDGTEQLRIEADGDTLGKSFGEDSGVVARGGDGVIKFGEIGSGLERFDFGATASSLAENGVGKGIEHDKDGDGVSDSVVLLDDSGNIVHSSDDGSGLVVDEAGNYAAREEDGSIIQNNVDGSFVHRHADGSSTWRTADGEIGRTIVNEQGQPFSYARNADGTDGRVLGNRDAPVEITLQGLDAGAGTETDELEVTDLGNGVTLTVNGEGDQTFTNAADGSGVRIDAERDDDPTTPGSTYVFGAGGELESWRTEDGAVGEITGDRVSYVNEHGHTYEGSADSILSTVAPELLDPGFGLGEVV